MKEDILFKAKDKISSKWLTGSCICITGECTEQIVQKKEYYYIVDEKGEKCAVDERTICRYAGMADKNGKKIFEHDYVRVYEPSVSEYQKNEVIFEYGCFKIRQENRVDAVLFHYKPEWVEITGNKFEK